jgi:hypothetical protein
MDVLTFALELTLEAQSKLELLLHIWYWNVPCTLCTKLHKAISETA